MKRLDWKEKLIFGLAVAAMVSVGSFFALLHLSARTSTDMAREVGGVYLREMTANSVRCFCMGVDDYFACLEAVSMTIRYADLEGEEELTRLLADMRENYGFTFLALMDEKGEYYSGGNFYPNALTLNVSGRLLESGQRFMGFDETIFGQRILVLGLSLEGISCGDKKITGILTGVEVSLLDRQVPTLGGQETYAGIAAVSGKYVVNDGEEGALPGGTNLFSQLEKRAVFENGFSLEQMRQDFEAGNTAVIGYKLDGQRYYLCYEPIPDTEWVMLNAVSGSLAADSAEHFNDRLMGNTMIVLVIVLGIESAFFLFFYTAAKRREEELARESAMRKDAEGQAAQALEIARIANESKSEFLSNMSHDIRTPMNAIAGLSMLLEKDAEDPERVRRYVKKILSSNRQMLGLITDLLDMSKMEAGKTALSVGEINLAELVEEIAAAIRPQAKAKQQVFSIVSDRVHDEYVLGDKLRISQIFVNLLSNAVKYTQPGGRIEFKIVQEEQRKKNYAQFCFEVKDNGCGMSEVYQKVLFEPFTREKNHATSKTHGTGLGMAITKNLVDLMGGTISVKSRVNGGTVFTVRLELLLQDVQAAQDFWSDRGIAKILVADDDPGVCSHIAGSMAGSGVEVQQAEDGETAVRMIREESERGDGYDLVLLDYEMSRMTGIETAEQIRRTVQKKEPVLILMSEDAGELAEDARKAGINGLMSKPFFLSGFRQAVERAYSRDGGDGQETEKESVLKGKHLLLAEDNELNAEILLEVLAMMGATAEVAENGRVAVEMFKKSEPGRYDAILMDVRMPVMSGYEAAETIRKSRHPQAKTIVIAALTASAFEEDVRDAIEAGMDAHIAKPVNLEQMEQTFRKLL